MPGWVLRCGLMVAALSPMLLGAPAALVLWLLMPLAVECCRVVEERFFCGAAILLLAGVCSLTLSENLYAMAILWGLMGWGMLLVKQSNLLKRSLIWTGLSAGMLCAGLAWLSSVYQGDIFTGLAWKITKTIYQHERVGEILLYCYQAGFASLESDLSGVVNLLGQLVMTEEIKLQLLYSLRTTVEYGLKLLLPQWIGAWLLLTLVLTTAVPDMLRRKRGEKTALPAFGAWRLTDWAHRHLNVLIIVYLVSLVAGNEVLTTMGAMGAAVFQYAYMILGLSVMEGLGKSRGSAKILRRLLMAGCILFAPFVLLIIGVIERGLDLRKLRRWTDDKGGNQQ